MLRRGISRVLCVPCVRVDAFVFGCDGVFWRHQTRVRISIARIARIAGIALTSVIAWTNGQLMLRGRQQTHENAARKSTAETGLMMLCSLAQHSSFRDAVEPLPPRSRVTALSSRQWKATPVHSGCDADRASHLQRICIVLHGHVADAETEERRETVGDGGVCELRAASAWVTGARAYLDPSSISSLPVGRSAVRCAGCIFCNAAQSGKRLCLLDEV